METGISPEATQKIQHFFKNWLVPLVVGAVIFISMFVIAIPTIRQASQLRQDLHSEQDKLAIVTTKLARLNDMNEAELDSQLFEAELALPSKKPVFETLTSLSNQASESGIILGDYDFSPGQVATESAAEPSGQNENVSLDKPGVLANMPLSLSLSGSSEGITKFLGVLSQSAPLIDVVKLSLATGTSSEEFQTQESELIAPGASANIEISVLYALPPQDIGRISDPLPEITPDQLSALNVISNLNKYSQNLLPTSTGKVNPFGF